MIEMTLPNEQVVSRVLGYCAEIDPDDMLDGEIVSPHLSLVEGLGQSVNASAVAAMLSRLPAIPVTLGRVRSYRHPGYDLLAIEAESDDLQKIHQAMTKHIAGAEECEYDPRIVLCKLKAGCGKAYSGEDRFEGEVLTLGDATVCGQDGKRESVVLTTPKKKVAFTGQEKVKHTEPLKVVDVSGVNGLTPEPLKVTPVKDLEPGPAPKEISLKSCWASLTREARNDLRRLRERGTDAAIHKACRAIRHATGDAVARGLLTQWVTKKWVKDDTVKNPRKEAKTERWVWVKEEDGSRGSTRYFTRGEDPNASRGAPREKPQGQPQQEGQEGEQQQEQKPAPEKKPRTQRGGKADPEAVGHSLNAMLTGEVPVHLDAALEMLMGVTVAQMQKIGQAMGLTEKDTAYGKKNKKDDIARKIAELAVAGKLAEAAAEDESEGIEMGGEPEQPAQQQAEPEQAQTVNEDDEGTLEMGQPQEQAEPEAEAEQPAPQPQGQPSEKDRADAASQVAKAINGSPVVALYELRYQLPESMQGKAFDEMILKLADEGKIHLSKDANEQSSQFSDKDRAGFVRDGEDGEALMFAMRGNEPLDAGGGPEPQAEQAPTKPAYQDRDRGRFRDNNETQIYQLPGDYEANPGAGDDVYAGLVESQSNPDFQGGERSRESEAPEHADPVRQQRALDIKDPVASAGKLFKEGPKSGLTREQAKESLGRILRKDNSGLTNVAIAVGVDKRGKKPAEVRAAIEQAILGKFPEEQAAPAKPAQRPADAPRGTGDWRPSKQQRTSKEQKREALAAREQAQRGVDPARRRMLEADDTPDEDEGGDDKADWRKLDKPEVERAGRVAEHHERAKLLDPEMRERAKKPAAAKPVASKPAAAAKPEPKKAEAKAPPGVKEATSRVASLRDGISKQAAAFMKGKSQDEIVRKQDEFLGEVGRQLDALGLEQMSDGDLKAVWKQVGAEAPRIMTRDRADPAKVRQAWVNAIRETVQSVAETHLGGGT